MRYIFTESQIKKIINNVVSEQPTKDNVFDSSQGEIKTMNGKTFVITTGEMGTKGQYPITLKTKIPDGTAVLVKKDKSGKILVYAQLKKGQPSVVIN